MIRIGLPGAGVIVNSRGRDAAHRLVKVLDFGVAKAPRSGPTLAARLAPVLVRVLKAALGGPADYTRAP